MAMLLNPVQLKQRITVILLTATSEIAKQLQYVQLGAKETTIKPFAPKLSPVHIETALG